MADAALEQHLTDYKRYCEIAFARLREMRPDVQSCAFAWVRVDDDGHPFEANVKADGAGWETVRLD